MNRNELLKTLAKQRKDEIVVFTMSAMKEWPRYSRSPLDFVVAGAMGYASSIGLGLALAQPQRRVWIIDGDGSLLMNLNTLVTISEHSPPNMVHLVLENGLYELPGYVPLPGLSKKTSLPGFAEVAGLTRVYEYSHLAEFKKHMDRILLETGPVFIDLKVEPGPREALDMGFIGSAAERVIAMEQALTEFRDHGTSRRPD